MSGGGGDGEGRWDARMDSTLPTNGTGDPDDKEDDDADNATNGDPAPAGSANNVLQTVPNGTTRPNPPLLDFLIRGRAPAQLDAAAVRFPPNENANLPFYVPFHAGPSAPRGSIEDIPVSPTSVRHPPGLTDRREPGPGYDVVPGTDFPRGGPVGQPIPNGVPGTDLPRGGPVGQLMPDDPQREPVDLSWRDEYLRDLDQRQAATIHNAHSTVDNFVEGFLGIDRTHPRH